MKLRLFSIGSFLLLLLLSFVNTQFSKPQNTKGNEVVSDIPLSEDFEANDSWLYSLVKPSREINPDDLYTFECEIRAKKPKFLSNTCADLGSALFNIRWSVWSSLGGVGEGKYRENNCNPNCAEGTISTKPATVNLTNLIFDGKRYFFTTAKIRFKGVSYADGEYEFIWDVAEFYREVPEMRSLEILED